MKGTLRIDIKMKIQDLSHMSDLEKVTGQGYFVHSESHTLGEMVMASPGDADGQ